MGAKTNSLDMIADDKYWNSSVNRAARHIIIELRKDYDDDAIYTIIEKFMDSVTIEENRKD